MSAGTGGPWTIQKVLEWTGKHFATRGCESPRLDAELLLADALGCNRMHLYTHWDQPLSEQERAAYRERVKRRATREPVAYIIGRREFYSRDFAVTPAVLIPRPETEHIIEAALAFVSQHDIAAPRILDIGTGSGNIAVVMACELDTAQVVATDIAKEALAVARTNAERHQVVDRVELRCGDLFAPIADTERFDLILSNPPYIENGTAAQLMPDVHDFEPHGALFAGADGLEYIEKLAAQAHGYLAEPGTFVCEIGHNQWEPAAELLSRHGAWQHIRAVEDLQGYRRVLVAER